MVGIILISNDTINNSTKDAAEIIAEDIAHVVSDSVLNAVATRRNMIDTSYKFSVDIPRTLAGKTYYVELTDEKVFVNSTDGFISVNCTTYNSEEFNYGLTGKAYGSNGRIKIFCEKVKDLYKFDFGTPDSRVSSGYITITDVNLSEGEWLEGWNYRLPLSINNSIPYYLWGLGINPIDLYSFSYPIILQPSYFDYSKAKEDGTDIRFYDRSNFLNGPLDYYIERWNPKGTSKIWVNITGSGKLEINQSKTIDMYFGNEIAENVQKSPREIFEFYEDFSNDDISNNWSEVTNNPEGINITSNSFLNLTMDEVIFTKDYNLKKNDKTPTLKYRYEGNFTYDSDPDPLRVENITVNATFSRYINYNLYMVESMMRLKPDDANLSAILGVLINLSDGVMGKLEKIFDESYFISSNYLNSEGYIFDKDYDLSPSAGESYLAKKTIPVQKRWFLQRTGLFIGTTYSQVVWGVHKSVSLDNYTIIGNARFNTTPDKNISSFVSLDDIMDTGLDTESETASGPPYVEGNIGIGLGSMNLLPPGTSYDDYLLVDWVKVYRALMYNLNITFDGIESNFSHWENLDKVKTGTNSLENDLFYDYNYGYTSNNFVIENLPDDDLFITIGTGLESSHYTIINIFNGSGTKISTVNASGKADEYSNFYSFIPAEKNDGALILNFETDTGKGWAVNTVTVEQGDKRINIGGDL